MILKLNTLLNFSVQYYDRYKEGEIKMIYEKRRKLFDARKVKEMTTKKL